MKSFTCGNCKFETQLPDDWPHPGYQCPGCGSGVTIVQQQAFATPQATHDLHTLHDYRDKTRGRDAMKIGFASSFGQSLGKQLGGCFGTLLMLGFILIVVFVFLMFYFRNQIFS